MSEDEAVKFKELGNEAFEAKNFHEALDFYTQAIQKDPTNHVYFSNRSASYAALEQYDNAANDAKECIRLNPTFLKGYYRLANALIEIKDYDHAQSTISQGLAIEPTNSQLTKQLRLVKQLQRAASLKQQQHPATQQLPSRLDETATQELHELQTLYAQTTRDLATTQANVIHVQREAKMAHVAHAELSLNDDEPSAEANNTTTTGYYRSIGKIFFQSTHEGVLNHLQTQQEELAQREKELLARQQYLERQVTSQRQNIQEIYTTATAASGLLALAE